MYASKLYAPTLRETPADAEVVSQKYMLRAGYIRKMAGGIYTYLPLAWRSLRKIENIIREELEGTIAQEVMLPIVQPSEIWQESGRWDVYGDEMFRLNDRHGRQYCLGPTHEEMMTTLVKGEVNSYRQLPLCLYQIQNKYRDERRPRYGLMRGREFIMQDGYSFDMDEEGLDDSYWEMYNAYSRIFKRCGLHVKPVEADSGAIGGSNSHEFMALADAGEAEVVHCTACDYAANVEIGKPGLLKAEPEEMLPLEAIETPNCTSMEEVASFVNLPLEKTIKAVVYAINGQVVLAVVRGDHDVNEIAVQHAVDSSIEPEMATEEDLARVGLTGGYISPIGLTSTEDFRIVVDESVMEMFNACAGGNKVDTHYLHVNPKRDFNVDDIIVTPIRLITTDDACPKCGGQLRIDRGIEVGQVFKLGTKYSESMQATFLNQQGRPTHFQMGCYGIGVSRTLAAAIEQFHDDDGIMLPMAIAPFEAVIIPINVKDEGIMRVAEEVYGILHAERVDVLFDDRNERAGVKFKDADLIGYPVRITVNKDSMETGEVEVKLRQDGRKIQCKVTKLRDLMIKIIDTFYYEE